MNYNYCRLLNSLLNLKDFSFLQYKVFSIVKFIIISKLMGSSS